MSIVFHGIFCSSSAPRVADEIRDLMTKTSGTEMDNEHLSIYLDILTRMIDDANKKGRHAKIVMSHKRFVRNDDFRVHGQISVYMEKKSGYADIARLYYIEVGMHWIVCEDGMLRMTYKASKEEGGQP